MKTRQSIASLIRLDGNRLQTYREQSGLTQADLARAANYTEDYVYRIERGLNRPLGLEALARFALALDCQPGELLVSDAADPPEVREARRRMLDIIASLALAAQADKAANQITWSDVLHLVASKREVTLSNELQDELYIGHFGLWIKAEEQALIKRERYAPGSREWAELTLRHCAWMCQQAGCPTHAEAYIAEVEQYYPPESDERAKDAPPDPAIRAQIALQRGWIQQQQYADYDQAVAYLTMAGTLAQEGGDQHTLSTAHALRYCLEMERAQTEGNAWLGALPHQTLSPQRRMNLQQTFNRHWRASYYLDPNNPNTAYQQFAHWNLRQADEAAEERVRERLLRLASDTNTEHIMSLHLARQHVSQQNWGRAEGFAKDALYGYTLAAFPLGIAFAAAVQAEAKARAGLRTDDDVRLFLDLWMLTLLCHGYRTHPLGIMARESLKHTVRNLATHHPNLLLSYCQMLNVRVLSPQKEGVFQALENVRPQALMLSPIRAPADYLHDWMPDNIKP